MEGVTKEAGCDVPEFVEDVSRIGCDTWFNDDIDDWDQIDEVAPGVWCWQKTQPNVWLCSTCKTLCPMYCSCGYKRNHNGFEYARLNQGEYNCKHLIPDPLFVCRLCINAKTVPCPMLYELVD